MKKNTQPLILILIAAFLGITIIVSVFTGSGSESGESELSALPSHDSATPSVAGGAPTAPSSQDEGDTLPAPADVQASAAATPSPTSPVQSNFIYDPADYNNTGPFAVGEPDPIIVNVSGKVISTKTKEGLGGALVELLDHKIPDEMLLTAEAKSSVKTNPDGTFSAEWEMPQHGVTKLRAGAAGFETRAAISRNISDNKAYVEISLSHAGLIAGRVINEEGKSIEGATVGMLIKEGNEDWRPGSTALIHGDIAVTDASGSFSLEQLAENVACQLPVEAHGYVGFVTEPVMPGTTNLEITLSRTGGTIQGMVLDGTSSPLKGISVSLHSPLRTSPNAITRVPGNADTKTENDGRFNFKDLPSGRYVVSAHRESTWLREEVTLAKGETRDIVLKFAPAKRIRVTALDTDNRAPVPGVQFLKSMGNSYSPRPEMILASSGHDGIATFMVETGSGTIRIPMVLPDGYLPAENPIGHPQIELPDEPEKTEIETEVLLTQGAILNIQVKETNGAPVVRANVSANYKVTRPGHSSSASKSFHADDAGRLTLTLPAGSTGTISGSNKSGVGQAEIPPLSSGSPADLLITLGEYASASGFAYLDGVPAPALQLLIRGEQRNYQVTTDADGYYFAEQLQPGTNTLTHVPNQDVFAVEDVVFTVKAGEYLQHQDIDLSRNDSIEFHITDTDENPVPDVRIHGMVVGGFFFNITTNHEGIAEVLSAKPGADFQHVSISHPEYRSPKQQSFRYEDAPYKIVLEKKDSIAIVLAVTKNGAPSENFMYRLSGNVHRQAAQGTHFPSGRVELADIDIGAYHVRVLETDAEGKRTGLLASTNFEIAAGDDGKEIQIALGSGGKIQGNVMNDRNVAVADAEVTLSPPGGWTNNMNNDPFAIQPIGPITVRSGADGAFVFENVPDTHHDLRAKHATAGMGRSHASPGNDVTIYLHPSTTVYGQAIARDGSPIVGARIQLEHDSPEPDALTDAEGKYRLETALSGGVIYLRAPHLQLEDSRSFHFNGGSQGSREVRVDFDYSSRVRLAGRLIVEGPGAATIDPHYLSFLSSGPSHTQTIEPGPDNTFSILLDPGEYTVKSRQPVRNVQGVMPQYTIDRFTLAASPREQSRDFHINLAAAEIVVVFPNDQDISPGRVALAEKGSIGHVEAYIGESQSTHAKIPSIITGTYTATFNSRDKKWEATTETEIRRGAENIIVLDARRVVRGTRIADWNINQHRQGIEITPHVKPGTTLALTVVMEHGSGNYILNIGRINRGLHGVFLHTSQHGTTGTVDQNNTFRFPIPEDAGQGPFYFYFDGHMSGMHDPNAGGGIYME